MSSWLPPQIETHVRSLFVSQPHCFRQIFQLWDIVQPADQHACNKLFLSKLLGMGIVAGSGLVKVPQVFKLMSAGNAKGWLMNAGRAHVRVNHCLCIGISLSSYVLETLAYSLTLSYNLRNNNPFSTYGETALVKAQNLVILALMLGYGSFEYHVIWMDMLRLGYTALCGHVRCEMGVRHGYELRMYMVCSTMPRPH
jgi:mannose-P-dolichol utilization defect protein 1